MGAVQFFLFGLLLAWFTGTGKLGALVSALRSSPQSSGGNQQPSQGNAIVPNPPANGAQFDPFGSNLGTQAASLAESQIGKKYHYGAVVDTTLKTIWYDCSSLVASVYGMLGKGLPRTSQDQANAVQKVASPSIGDLVFGSFSAANDHVGIYVGNGQVVSALDESHGVLQTAANWPSVWFGHVA